MERQEWKSDLQCRLKWWVEIVFCQPPPIATFLPPDLPETLKQYHQEVILTPKANGWTLEQTTQLLL